MGTITVAILLSLLWIGKLNFLFVGMILFILFVLYQANRAHNEWRQQRELYEEMVVEYRKAKRLAQASTEEARNEERTKIARDIHDSVGHKLTALLMQLEILSIQQGEGHFTELKNLAQSALDETRAAVKALQSDEREGIATILQLIKKLEAESHIQVHFTTRQGVLSTKLSNQQSITLYRVIQEGLTNAMRHAHSREVHVVLGRTAIGGIEFLITNFIHDQTPIQEGFGIQNMRKRVQEIGGDLVVYKTEEQFVLRGQFPVSEGDMD